jgi:hypothetical protein
MQRMWHRPQIPEKMSISHVILICAAALVFPAVISSQINAVKRDYFDPLEARVDMRLRAVALATLSFEATLNTSIKDIQVFFFEQ